MRQFDFAPLYRSTVGFDRLAQLMDSVGGFDGDGYPPYNIERTGDNEYRITMAVAGFSRDELHIDVKESTLVVTGVKEARRQGAQFSAPRHRRPQLRAALPARRLRRGQGRRIQGRPLAHRPSAQSARAHEAAHDRDRVRRRRQAARGTGLTEPVTRSTGGRCGGDGRPFRAQLRTLRKILQAPASRLCAGGKSAKLGVKGQYSCPLSWDGAG